MPDDSAHLYMTVAQVSQRLGVSTATVYRLCKEGVLGHVRVLNVVRIAQTALAALLSRSRDRR